MPKKEGMKGGMRSAKMPSEHKEVAQGELGHNCKEKYATEFGNPADLDRNNKALADFVRKKKMKY